MQVFKSRPSKIDQVKIAFKKFERIWSAEADHIPSNFLKAVFHKFYLDHSEYFVPYYAGHLLLVGMKPCQSSARKVNQRKILHSLLNIYDAIVIRRFIYAAFFVEEHELKFDQNLRTPENVLKYFASLTPKNPRNGVLFLVWLQVLPCNFSEI